MLILMDNGSLEPAATLALRGVAAALSARLGEPVAPVSLLHSAKIPADELGGTPAQTMERFIAGHAAAGVVTFRILPLFFGPSLALVDYLPQRLAALRQKFPALAVSLAPCLCADEAGEAAVATMLADRVHDTGAGGLPGAYTVILCDHGSPARPVTAVRDRLATRLHAALGGETPVSPASMERREGAEYDFNDPLLAAALAAAPAGDVIVAMQFLLPGRHAGEGGDVATICTEAESRHPGLRVSRTALLADHPLLQDLLARRACA